MLESRACRARKRDGRRLISMDLSSHKASYGEEFNSCDIISNCFSVFEQPDMNESKNRRDNNFLFRITIILLCNKRIGDSAHLSRRSSGRSREAGKTGSADFMFLTFLASVSGLFMIYINLMAGALAFLALIIFCFYYAYLCNKKFGGVTGDTAGMFVARGELIGLLVLAVCFFVVRL